MPWCNSGAHVFGQAQVFEVQNKTLKILHSYAYEMIAAAGGRGGGWGVGGWLSTRNEEMKLLLEFFSFLYLFFKVTEYMKRILRTLGITNRNYKQCSDPQ